MPAYLDFYDVCLERLRTNLMAAKEMEAGRVSVLSWQTARCRFRIEKAVFAFAEWEFQPVLLLNMLALGDISEHSGWWIGGFGDVWLARFLFEAPTSAFQRRG
jgi:hypothetical protein